MVRLAQIFETVDDIPSRSVSIAVVGGGACPGSTGRSALVAHPKVERSPRPTDLVTAGNVNLSARLRGLGRNLIADSENPRSWGSSTVYTGGANAAAAPHLKAAGDASACNSCNLADYGATVAAAKAAGLTVAVMAHVTPDWVQMPGHYEGWENGNVGFGPCPDTGGNRPPAWTDPPMFGTFIESQILSMPEVDAWSLWSEVDTAASWCVGIISLYGRPAAAELLLKRVMQPGYAAVKAIRPDVPAVGLGLYDLRDGGELFRRPHALRRRRP